jgi:VWFA-related protein
MKSFAYILLAFVVTFISCQKDLTEAFSGPIGCNEDLSENSFNISIQDESVQLPGQVSVFFKVDDKNGKPVAGLNNSSFSIFEKGRNDDCFKKISSFESNAQISPNEQIFNYTTMLVLDLSGSVLQNSLEELKNASKQFIQNVIVRNPDDSFEVGIWWFDGEDNLHRLQSFTDKVDVLLSKIDQIDQNISSDPSTDLYGAILKSSELANKQVEDFQAKDIIGASSVVVFTDGTDQAARYTKEEAIDAVNKSKETVNFYTIGLGNEIDASILRKIGTAGSIIATETENLEETFKQTSDQVYDEANSYYFFEYCSPKRDGSGINELILHVTNAGLKGYVETAFDATGFESGCN